MALPDANDFWGWIGYILQNYGPSLLKGAGTTMVIAVASTAIGCVIGFAAGIVQTIPADKEANPARYWLVQICKFILNVYVEVFRGTPMMVQAMFIYYGAAMLFNIHWGMWTAAIFIVSINTGAYMAETVRGGILSIDPGQTEGAMAIGMNHVQTMMAVILPQALRNIMPQIGNNLIINIKDTCVLSVIGTMELFYTSKSISGAYYTYFQTFTITMVMYFILTFTCSRILRWLEKKMDGPVNFDLAVADPLVPGEGMHRYQKNPKEPNSDYRAKKRTARADEALKSGRPAERFTHHSGDSNDREGL